MPYSMKPSAVDEEGKRVIIWLRRVGFIIRG
jgi:hypothetical protein